MHRRRIMALARSGLCRQSSGAAESLMVRRAALPMLARSYGSFSLAHPLAQYGVTMRSLPTSAFLRLAGGKYQAGMFASQRLCVLPSGARPTSSTSLPIHETVSAPLGLDTTDRSRRPLKEFEDVLPTSLFQALSRPPFAYETMTPVQVEVLSLLSDLTVNEPVEGAAGVFEVPKRDVLIQARTGTGKTVAYLMALITARLDYLAKLGQPAESRAGRPPAKVKATGVGALVLAPTRELAMQIAKTAVSLCSAKSRLNVRLFIAGAAPKTQIHEFLSLGPADIVVATPGRLIDVVNSRPTVKEALAETRTLVLDEADRMLAPNMVEQINELIDIMAEEHQTVLVSATLPEGVRKIADDALRPEYAMIDSIQVDLQADNADIPQYITVLPSYDQTWPHILRLLAHDALLHPHGGKAIIFMPSADMATLGYEMLFACRNSLPWGSQTHVLELSRKMGYTKREAAASIFSRAKGAYTVMVTTDITGRGLDYTGVTRVIQLCIPSTADAYLHRIGRTARAGESGRADMVLLPLERNYLHGDPFRGQRAKPLTIYSHEDDVMQLAEAHDAEVVSKGTRSRRLPDGHIGTIDQTGASMQPNVADRLQLIERDMRQVGWPAVKEATVQHAFNSLIGFYSVKTGTLWRRLPTLIKFLTTFVQRGCGYKADPVQRLPNSLRETLGMEPIERSGRLFNDDGWVDEDEGIETAAPTTKPSKPPRQLKGMKASPPTRSRRGRNETVPTALEDPLRARHVMVDSPQVLQRRPSARAR